MNQVYECNGTNIFMRRKMMNGIFHLSLTENICSIAQMRKHSFVLYNLYNWKIQILKVKQI